MTRPQTAEQRDIRLAIARHAENIVQSYLGKPNRNLSNGKQLRWNCHGSFALDPLTGKWADYESGDFGDIFDFIAREERIDQSGAFLWAVRYLGGSAPHPSKVTELKKEQHRHEKERAREAAAKLADAALIWDQGMPLLMSSAERYLVRRLGERVIPAPIIRSSAIRYHQWPVCTSINERPPDGMTGAMIARMIDPLTGRFVCIQRTFLDGQYRKICRKMLGGSGVVMLVDRSCGDLGICEGLENGIRIIDLFDRPGPLWATMNAGNMSKFPLLPGLTTIDIFPDRDRLNTRGGRAGDDAAIALRTRWQDAGRCADIAWLPNEGADWADLDCEEIPVAEMPFDD